MFRVWLITDMRLTLAEIASHARRAETLGADVLSLADAGFDGFLGAQSAISVTTRIEIATAGAVCFARSPLVTALASWNLSALSAGRFRLGLSPLVPAMLIEKYGIAWHPPAPRMREYIGALRAVYKSWQTDVPLHYVGKHYRLTRQNSWSRPAPIEDPDIPIHIGAIGPRMSALAGECASGLLLHPTNSASRYLREIVIEEIERGARRKARSLTDFELVVMPMCATGKTSDEAHQQREAQRRMFAIFLSTPQYWPALELFGWKATGERLLELWREGREDLMGEQLTEEMLDAFMPTAPYHKLAGVLRERFGGLARGICLQLPSNSEHDVALGRLIRELQE
ncbi:MAG: hypothetical protein NAOJABEB_01728 [Steroidobacteraceae bacterium]|nr:hypothetical protein [Steroidobacteraceae bacterium]